MLRAALLVAALWLLAAGTAAAAPGPSVRLAAPLPAGAEPGVRLDLALEVRRAQRLRLFLARRATSRPHGPPRAGRRLRPARPHATRPVRLRLRFTAPPAGRHRLVACVAATARGRQVCRTLPGALRVVAPALRDVPRWAPGPRPAIVAPAPPPAPPPALVPEPPPADPVPPPPATERIPLGTAVWSSRLADPSHAELVRRFDSLTPENELKWEWVQPTRGTFAFAGPDALVETARADGQTVRGHTLVWHQQLPPWVGRAAADPDDLRAVLIDHVRTVVSHFAGRIESWDVVNEPLTEDGELREDVWSTALGRDYLALAFRTAREADPEARLFLNEVAAEGASAKADGLVALAEELVDAGVPVDGVGLQLHTNAWGFPSQAQLEKTMRRFTDLGLDVEITEADVGALAWPEPSEREARQEEAWRAAAGACAAVERCTRMTVWGVHDGVSWLGAEERGTLVDADGQPKPVFDLVRGLLQRQAG